MLARVDVAVPSLPLSHDRVVSPSLYEYLNILFKYFGWNYLVGCRRRQFLESDATMVATTVIQTFEVIPKADADSNYRSATSKLRRLQSQAIPSNSASYLPILTTCIRRFYRNDSY